MGIETPTLMHPVIERIDTAGATIATVTEMVTGTAIGIAEGAMIMVATGRGTEDDGGPCAWKKCAPPFPAGRCFMVFSRRVSLR